MTDLLTPEEVRQLLSDTPGVFVTAQQSLQRRLCRDYLTLWEKNEKKRAALKVLGVIESVLELCEEERDALKERVKELEELVACLKEPKDYPA